MPGHVARLVAAQVVPHVPNETPEVGMGPTGSSAPSPAPFQPLHDGQVVGDGLYGRQGILEQLVESPHLCPLDATVDRQHCWCWPPQGLYRDLIHQLDHCPACLPELAGAKLGSIGAQMGW